MSVDYGSQQFQQRQFGHRPSDAAKPVDHEFIRNSLKMPSKGLIVTGVLSIILSIGGLAGGIIYSSVNRENIQRYWVVQLYGSEIKLNPGGGRSNKHLERIKEQREGRAATAFTLVLGAIAIGCLTLTTLYMTFVSGGIMMGGLRKYNFCRIVCIMAMIPGLSPLLVAGIPFGIVGYTKLSRPGMKKAFN